MMGGMLMVLLLGGQFNGLLAHPPLDLASLLEPAAVLQKLDVKTTEDALLDVLKAKPDAAAEGDEGDVLYVKKLMAIRLLEQTKSKNALPVLQDVVKEPDVTLRDAAQEAIAAISGKPSPRPSGATLLKEIARSLPDDAGFVAALDMERASKATTLRMFLEAAMKEAEAKGLLNLPKAPEGMTAEDAAQMKAQAKAQMKEALDAELTEMTDGLGETLADFGNLRIDAAAMFVSADAGTKPDAGYAGIVFKGLYDPERFAKLLKQEDYKEREVAGRKVLVEENSPQFCLLDANTLVVIFSPNGAETVHMEKVLRALTAAEKTPPKPALAAAFDLVTEKQMRLAASGTLSQAQKDSLRAELGEADAGAEPIGAAGRLLLLSLLPADGFTAAFDEQGKLSAQAAFADKAAAAALSDAATKIHKLLLGELAKMGQSAPPLFHTMLDPVLKGAGLWQTEVADKTVTITAASLTPISAMAMPLFFWLGAAQGQMDEGGQEMQFAQPVLPAPPEGR